MSKDRYEELKSRGWKHLNGDERGEFKKLRVEFEGGDGLGESSSMPEFSEETKELKPNPETVTVTKDEWDNVLKTINELKKAQGDAPLEKSDNDWKRVKEEDRTHVATLRQNDDGDYAVDLKLDKERSKWNDKTREFDIIYKITWRKENDEKYDTYILLADFIKYPTQQVYLVKKYVEKLEKLTGERKLQQFTDDQYKIKTGKMIDLKVTADNITFDIRLPSGKIWYNFPSGRLNL